MAVTLTELLQYRDVGNPDHVRNFCALMYEIPGLVKARAAYELNCKCGDPACFMDQFLYLALECQWIEPSDIEDLIKRWEGMTIITFGRYDAIIREWIDEYFEVRRYRLAKATIAAVDHGPGATLEFDDGAHWVDNNNQPPDDIMEEFRQVVLLN